MTDGIEQNSMVTDTNGIHSLDLDQDTYGYWYDIIRANDVTKASSILLESQEKPRLLNGSFKYKPIKTRTTDRVIITRPLILAAAFGATATLDLMLERGADPEVLDDAGCNIFHGLVIVSTYDSTQGQKVIDMFDHLCMTLGKDIVQRLLVGENLKGLRPLEFAAQQGKFGLMLRMLDAGHVYKRQTVDVMEYLWYDVTDYELNPPHGRRHLSPMHFICNMDEDNLPCALTSHMMVKGPIQRWLDAKKAAYSTVFFTQMLLQFIKILGFFVVDLDAGILGDYGGVSDLEPPEVRANASFVYCHNFTPINLPGMVRRGLMIFLAVASGISLITFIYRHLKSHLVRNLKERSYTLLGRRRPIKQCKIYRTSEFLFSAMLLAYCTMSILRTQTSIVIFDFLRAGLTSVAILTAFYYIQVAPVVGTFFITVIGMVQTLLKFCVLFIIIQLAFVTVMTNIVNTHSMVCYADFSSFLDAWGTLFRMMLAMVDSTEYTVAYQHMLNFINIEYVVITGILLLNFLVAIMSYNVSEIKDHRNIVMNIQRIMVASDMEDVAFSVSWKLHRWCLTHCPGFASIDGRHCVVHGRSNIPSS